MPGINWDTVKRVFKPRTIAYTLGGIGAGAALIASPFSPFGTAIAGGIGLIGGYMVYDIINKNDIYTQFQKIDTNNEQLKVQLEADDIGKQLIRAALANNQRIERDKSKWMSPSTAAILNKIGNSVATVFVTAGMIDQAIGLPREASEEGNKVAEISGTAIAACGLGLALTTHYVTAPILRTHLKEVSEIKETLTVLQRKHAVNAALTAVEAEVQASTNQDITYITAQHKLT